MKKVEIVKAYRTINAAKLTKMADEDKFIVIRAMKAMKPIVTEIEEFVKDAQEKLKDEQYDVMVAKATKWQEECENTSLIEAERAAINRYFAEYNSKVEKCVGEEGDKDVELDYKRLSEEGFAAFVGSNDYDVETIMDLSDILCCL